MGASLGTDAAAFERELAALGVRAELLAPSERTELLQRGFCLLAGVLAGPELERARALCEAELARAGEPPAGTGTRHAEGCERSSPELAHFALAPRVLAAARHVLARPFRLRGIAARDPRRGHGLQALHRDWLPLAAGEPPAAVTALLLLDAYRGPNGATRVVPGSHLVPGDTPRGLRAPAARHPHELRVQAPAGTALVFSGHLLHAGTRNESGGTRRVLQVQLVAHDRRGAASCAAPLEAPPLLALLTSP